MPVLGGLDPALAIILLLALNGLVPFPRAAICIPAGAALGWAALGPAMAGTAIGFVLGFALSRFALRSWFERLLSARPRLAIVTRAIDAEGWRLLAMLRFASPVPGPLINAACGVTRMRLVTFLVTGSIAVLPQTALFIYLGRAGSRALSSGSVFGTDTLTGVLGVALTMVALWRIGVAAKRQSAQIMAEAATQAA